MKTSVVMLMCLALMPIVGLAQPRYPPAPFSLRTTYENPTLFRMDHVGGCSRDGLERDILELHWEGSWWQPPYTDRNDPTDTVRYEVCFIVQPADGGRPFLVTLPSISNGLAHRASLRGSELFPLVFRPPVPLPDDFDSVVMRVPWFVRATNSQGITTSDTAGISLDFSPVPTSPLVLSYNRPPAGQMSAIIPRPGSTVTGISLQANPTDVIWTPATDLNTRKGAMINAFHVYNPRSRSWDVDRERTVDTLRYQWTGEVVRTSPPGTGAPVGSMLVKPTGVLTGVQLTVTDYELLFLDLGTPPTSRTADTVVLDWMVYAKDFEITNTTTMLTPSELVGFRHRPDGELSTDTAKWSRFGCRPHELTAGPYRLTLVRAGITAVEAADRVPHQVELGDAHPNPFTGWTTVTCSSRLLPMTVEVYDIHGRAVLRLAELPPGSVLTPVRWDGRNASGLAVPSGVYVIRATTGSATRHLMVTRLR